jgi:hypothetical protein
MPRHNLISLRSGTENQWTSTNPILSSGEPGFEIDTGKLKIGYGGSGWNSLYYTAIHPTGLLAGSNIGVALGTNGSSATISVTGTVDQAEQSQSLVTTVFNETGASIAKMTAVYINGGHGDLPTIQKAIATSDITSAGTYGLVYQDIDNMEIGQVVVFGLMGGVNTDPAHGGIAGATEGSVLYLSPTVSGAITTTKPYAPDHIVSIGTVVRVHQNEGVIEVRVQNGFELEELHNVAVTGATNGQFLQYNSGSGLWVPSSSGNFTSLSVNSTGVSLSGHNHNGVYADIATGDPQTPSNSIVDRAYALYDLPNDWAALWINDAAVYAADNAIFDSFKINMGLTEAVIGTGIANHVAYWNSSSGIVADSGQLYWDSANNRLGISTSTPSGALDVRGTSYFGSTGVANNLYLRTGQAGISETALKLRTDTSSNLYLDASSAYVKVGNQSADVDIRAGNSNVTIGNSSAGTLANQFIRFMPANTERMRLDGNGNLGIGTTSPSSILHISQNDAILRIADASSNTSTGPRLELNSNYGGSLYSAYLGFSYYNNKTYLQHGRASIGGIELRRANGTSALYVQDSNGYIGIGTTTPSGQLHVAGDVLATGSFIAGSGSASNPSFEFVGDTDTGMFAPAANTIGLATSGVERLRINNLGNIGIGITAPTAKLDVRGSFSCGMAGGDPSVGAQGLFIDPSIPSLSFNDIAGPTTALTVDNDGLTLYDTSAAGFFYTDRANARIGIGTNSPAATLDVNGVFKSLGFTSYGSISWFGNSAGSVGIAANTNPSGTFGSNTEFACFQGFNDAVTSYNPICFTTQNGAQVYLNTDGRVGIGTASPAAKLDVNGTAFFGSNLLGRIEFGEDTFGGELGFYDNNGNTLALRYADGSFQYGGGSPGAANLVVTSSGNVGIGGIDPDTKLQVYGDFVCSPAGGGFSAKNGEQGVYINSDGTLVIIDNGPSAVAYLNANGLSLYADIGAGGGTIFSTDRSNSRIGIGTSTPSTTLDVLGDVNIDGNLTFDSFTESVVANGSSGTSKTLSLASGTVHTCTLTGNCTFTMPTATAGKSFSLFLNTGAGSFTATFTGVRWSDSTPPTITSTASKVDLLSFISDGTYWYGSFSQNYG